MDAEKGEEGDSRGVSVRWLITKDDGADNFAMRYFEVEPGGQTALHSHCWEHEVFILDGQGLVVCGGSERRVNRGYVVLIPPNMGHHLKNTGKGNFSFLCLIPYRK